MTKRSFTPEQQQVIDYRGKRLLVSASAGTGKTTVMIQRILSLIKEGADISQFVVVTFTKLAATEMKNRLAAELSDAYGDDRITDQLERLDMATISTMHSFCSDLLHSYFYVADVDPSFTVLDDITAASLRESCLDEVFKQYLAENDKTFIKTYKIFSNGRQEDNFRKTLRKLYDFSRGLENFSEWYSQKRNNLLNYSDDNPVIKAVADNLAYNVSHLRDCFASLADTCLQENLLYLDFCRQNAEKLSFDLSDFPSAVNSLLNTKLTQMPRGNAKKLSDNADASVDEATKANCKQLKEQFDDIKKSYAELFRGQSVEELWQQTAATVEYTDKLVEIICRFDELFTQAKRQRGGIDFDDMEHLALRVLKNPEACEEIRSRYKYIFVDEYQDTSPIQEALIQALDAENVFMVGDVKQSIYGFRGCEPSIFIQKYNDYNNGGEGKAIKLNDNFRTNNHVFDFVNLLFAQTMTRDFGMIDYASDAMLKGPVQPTLKTPSVKINLVTKVAKEKVFAKGLYDITDTLPDNDEVSSAQVVADNIRSYVGMAYKTAEGARRIDYGDIVILLRSMSGKSVDLYNCLVENNIPVVASFKTDAYANKEIRDVVNLLRVVDNPYNELYLCGVCLSCFGKMTENDLGRLRLETGGRKNFYDRLKQYVRLFPHDELTQKIKTLNELIEKVRFFARGASVCETVLYLIKLTDYTLYVQGLPNGDMRLSKLYAFIDKLRDASFAQTVDKFLAFLDEADREEADEAIGSTNAVRIMTMHASKGLEFPIVIVADLDRKFNLRPSAVRFNTDLGIAMDYYDFRGMKKASTLGMTACAAVNDLKQKEEEMRILYVAMTRAKFVLNVVASVSENTLQALSVPPRNATRHLDWVLNTLKTSAGGLCNDVELQINSSVVKQEQTTSSENELLCKQYTDELALKALEYRYPYANQAAMPLKLFSSAIAQQRAEGDDDEATFAPQASLVLGDAAEERNKVGTAYHKALQRLSFNATDEQIEQALLQLVDDDVCERQHIDMLDKKALANILRNPQLISLCKGTVYKELPFMLSVEYNKLVEQSDFCDKVMLQGVIDLLAVDGNRAVVVDYKYTAHSDKIKQSYGAQLNSYKLAVKQILGISDVDCYVVSVADGKVIHMD